MKSKFLWLIAGTLVLSACKTQYSIQRVDPHRNISISENLKEDATMANIIAPYKKELESKMNTKISYTAVDLSKQGDNSNLGNLLADFTYDGGNDWAKKNGFPNGADAAVINIGGIRSMIGKGNILTKHVYEVMPFENEIVLVQLTGEQLSGLFDYYLKTQKNNPVSKIFLESDAGKLLTSQINGKEVIPTKLYNIVTSDYLALGGDSMNFFKQGKMISTGIKMRDLFLQKFAEKPEIIAPKDIRLIFRNKPNKTNHE